MQIWYSHELRTPVTLILGPVEDLLSDKDTPLEPSIRDSLRIVSRNAQRLLNLASATPSGDRAG